MGYTTVQLLDTRVKAGGLGLKFHESPERPPCSTNFTGTKTGTSGPSHPDASNCARLLPSIRSRWA